MFTTVYVVYSKDYEDMFKLVGIFTDRAYAEGLCKKDLDLQLEEIELDKEVNEYF